MRSAEIARASVEHVLPIHVADVADPGGRHRHVVVDDPVERWRSSAGPGLAAQEVGALLGAQVQASRPITCRGRTFAEEISPEVERRPLEPGSRSGSRSFSR